MLGHPGNENWEDFLAQAGAVISTGINSAAKTLQILTSEYSLLSKRQLPFNPTRPRPSVIKQLTMLLDVFLPYDLEFTFGAAIHLTMANALFPGVLDYEECHQLTHQILGYLISRGNRVARARKSELLHLESLFQNLVDQVQQQGHQTLDLSCFGGTVPEASRRGDEEQDGMPGVYHGPHPLENEADPAQSLGAMNPPMASEMGFLDDLGISSEAFLSIVQQMGDPETLPDSMLTLN